MAELHNGAAQVRGLLRHSMGRRIPVAGRATPEGVFAEWAWDGRRLLVENDRYGLWPMYWFADANRVCVAGSLRAVVCACSLDALDFDALGVFFRLGHFIGDDTPFQGVRTLPPGSRLIWQDGQMTLDRPDGLPVPQKSGALSLEDAADRYAQLFAQAIARRRPTSEGFIVPISGGRDSRHILLELHRQGHSPRHTVTVRYRPPTNDEDIRIGRLLSARVGADHVVVDRPVSLLAAALADIRTCHHSSGGHAWAAPFADYLVQRANSVYDGLAGDVLSAGLLQTEAKQRLFEANDYRPLATHLLEEAGRETGIQASLSADWLRRMPLQAAVARLVSELERHRAHSNPTLSYVFWNRTRRYVGLLPFAMLAQLPCVHTPFLDHDLFDFLVGLAPELVAKNRLHDATIRYAYPEFADIEFEQKTAPRLTTAADAGYYRRTRHELINHLKYHATSAPSPLRMPSVALRIWSERLTRRAEEPWYLYPLLQAMELEGLRGGAAESSPTRIFG